MFVQKLYNQNPKKFEEFLLSDYHGNFKLKLDKVDEFGISFELYVNRDYYSRVIVTDYYVDEPETDADVDDCRYTRKSMKLVKMLAEIGGKEYIRKYIEFRDKIKENIIYKFDSETKRIVEELNKIGNATNVLKQ